MGSAQEHVHQALGPLGTTPTTRIPIDTANARERAMPTRRPTEESRDTTQLLHILTALRKGAVAVRLPLDGSGVCGKVAHALNDRTELPVGTEQLLAHLRAAFARPSKGRVTYAGRLHVIGTRRT
jgi:hypothetical protein